jgi:hypothetical protein
VWDAPSYFEYRQQSSGVTSVAGHRVGALAEARSRLALTLDMRGLMVAVVALFFKGLTNRYMTLQAQGMKRAAESAWQRERAVKRRPRSRPRGLTRPLQGGSCEHPVRPRSRSTGRSVLARSSPAARG